MIYYNFGFIFVTWVTGYISYDDIVVSKANAVIWECSNSTKNRSDGARNMIRQMSRRFIHII